MAKLRNPSGATSTAEAQKRKQGRKGGKCQTEKTPNRTSSIGLCQPYAGQQLLVTAVVQTRKANKGQAGTAITGFHGQRYGCLP